MKVEVEGKVQFFHSEFLKQIKVTKLSFIRFYQIKCRVSAFLKTFLITGKTLMCHSVTWSTWSLTNTDLFEWNLQIWYHYFLNFNIQKPNHNHKLFEWQRARTSEIAHYGFKTHGGVPKLLVKQQARVRSCCCLRWLRWGGGSAQQCRTDDRGRKDQTKHAAGGKALKSLNCLETINRTELATCQNFVWDPIFQAMTRHSCDRL